MIAFTKAFVIVEVRPVIFTDVGIVNTSRAVAINRFSLQNNVWGWQTIQRERRWHFLYSIPILRFSRPGYRPTGSCSGATETRRWAATGPRTR